MGSNPTVSSMYYKEKDSEQTRWWRFYVLPPREDFIEEYVFVTMYSAYSSEGSSPDDGFYALPLNWCWIIV